MDKAYTLNRFLNSDTSGLSNAEFRVMTAICSYCYKAGTTTFVSQSRIAKEHSMSQPNVSRAISSLKNKKWLINLPKKGKSNHYKVIIKGSKDGAKRKNKDDKRTDRRSDGSHRQEEISVSSGNAAGPRNIWARTG